MSTVFARQKAMTKGYITAQKKDKRKEHIDGTKEDQSQETPESLSRSVGPASSEPSTFLGSTSSAQGFSKPPPPKLALALSLGGRFLWEKGIQNHCPPNFFGMIEGN